MVLSLIAAVLEREVLLKFFKFGIVGLSGVIVDFGITYFFKEKLKVQKYIANSAGFLTATVTNYFLNRFWTFHSADPEIFIQFGKFFFFSIIGLIINNLIIYVLNDRMKMNFYVSKLVAIGVVSLWNFSINYIYTFTS